MDKATEQIYMAMTKKQLIAEIDNIWSQRDIISAMLLGEYVPTKTELLDLKLGESFIQDLIRSGLTNKYKDV